MKLVSFVAIKGGVGKTTLALLTGQYLAQKGNKVLFIDLDHQCNLSHFYNIYQDSQTVSNIFTGIGDVSILSIAPNIDLIPGSMRLDEAERKLETNPNQNMRLYDWLDDNYDSRNLEQYDFVIIDSPAGIGSGFVTIDCRPDFGIATRNAIAVSHTIFSPITPSDFAFEAKENLEIRLEQYRQTEIIRPSRESLITAKLFFLPNMIKHNTAKSKELLEVLQSEEGIVHYIPQKELFNRASQDNTIIDMMNDSVTRNVNRGFFFILEETLEQVESIIQQS